MLTLNDIIANEEIVLIDCNVLEGYDRQTFCADMYHANDFSQINNGMLGDKLASARISLQSIMHNNVFTIKEVADELKALAEILGKKLAYISDAGVNTKAWMTTKQRLEPRKKIDARNNVRSNLAELQDVVYEASRAASSKDIYDGDRFGIDVRCRDTLLTMIKEIDSAVGLKLKKIVNYRHKQVDKSRASDTDEKLAVAIYCLSMFSGKRASFVTGDTDFIGLLVSLPKMIGAQEFAPYNDDFREALVCNPFKFWLYNSGYSRFDLRLDSTTVSYDRLFETTELSKQDSDKLKDRISKLWQEFYAHRHEQMHAAD